MFGATAVFLVFFISFNDKERFEVSFFFLQHAGHQIDEMKIWIFIPIHLLDSINGKMWCLVTIRSIILLKSIIFTWFVLSLTIVLQTMKNYHSLLLDPTKHSCCYNFDIVWFSLLMLGTKILLTSFPSFIEWRNWKIAIRKWKENCNFISRKCVFLTVSLPINNHVWRC